MTAAHPRGQPHAVGAAVFGSLWALLLVGCYELPPEIPAGYLTESSARPAIYHDDPFHAANLLHHRLTAVAGLSPGVNVDLEASSPASREEAPIDASLVAEVSVLCEELERALAAEGAPQPLTHTEVGKLRADLERWLAELSGRGQREQQARALAARLESLETSIRAAGDVSNGKPAGAAPAPSSEYDREIFQR